NRAALEELAQGWADIREFNLATRDENDAFVGDYRAQETAKDVLNALDDDQPTEVVLDLAAFPAYISYPFADGMIRGFEGKPSHNLHVSIGVEQKLDDRIHEVPATARYLAGFESTLQMQGKETVPKVWVPVLGPGRENALEKLRELIN